MGKEKASEEESRQFSVWTQPGDIQLFKQAAVIADRNTNDWAGRTLRRVAKSLVKKSEGGS